MAAKDTLLLCKTKRDELKVPDRLGGITLKKLGKACFMQNASLQKVVFSGGLKKIEACAFAQNGNLHTVYLPGSLRWIGDEAFANCPKLREIILYNIPLSTEEYEGIKASGRKVGDNRFIVEHIPQRIADLHFPYAKPAVIPEQIRLLFQLQEEIGDGGPKRLYAEAPYLSFEGRTETLWEDKVFREHLRDREPEPDTELCDNAMDCWAKSNRIESMEGLEKICLVVLDENKTRRKGEKVNITLRMKMGIFFWQSGKRVRCEKKDYYVYRRYYLSSHKEIQYLRQDTAVYCGDRLVTDWEEAQRVYEKYRFLSVL